MLRDENNVIEFKRHDNADDSPIIESLQKLMDEAKAGKLTGIAFIVTRIGQETGTGWLTRGDCDQLSPWRSLVDAA